MTSPGQHKQMPWSLRVARGESGTDWIRKFGHNDDIDTASTPEDVWSGGGLYTFTANGGANYYISSSDNSDTQDIEIRCLTEDANGDWNQEDVTVTLAGQTKTLISFSSGDLPVRFYRGYNSNSTDLAGIVYIYEDDTVVAGVPQTASKKRGEIHTGSNQTEMAIYTIPSGYEGYLVEGHASIAGSVKNELLEFAYYIRLYNGVFRIQWRGTLTTNGSNWFKYDFKASYLPIPAKTDVKVTALNVTANNMGMVAGFDILLLKL